MNTKKLAELSLLAALSLAIYILESFIPPLLPVPGIRLGLSNIITIFVLCRFGIRDAALVLSVRLILSAVFVGQITYFFYSLSGAVLSFAVMAVLVTVNKKRLLIFTGAFGGLFHNIGQLLTALFLMGSPYILSYLPFLMISGIITGIFTGAAAAFLLRYLPEKDQ